MKVSGFEMETVSLMSVIHGLFMHRINKVESYVGFSRCTRIH